MTDATQPSDSVLVHGHIQWGSGDLPLDRLTALAAAVQASHPGNRYYRFSIDAEDPQRFYLNEAWESLGDFTGHGVLPETVEIGAVVRSGATDVQLNMHQLSSSRPIPFALQQR